MLRTKPLASNKKAFDSNSYSSPDSTNSIKWDSKTENEDVYEYYRGLIAFRKAHGALRMTTTEEVQENLTFLDGLKGNAVGYTISNQPNEESAETLLVVHNGNNKAIDVALPDGTWAVYVNAEKAGTTVLEKVSGTISVDKISTIVLAKENKTSQVVNSIKNIDKRIWIGIGIAIIVIVIIILIIWRNRKKKRRHWKEVIYYR